MKCDRCIAAAAAGPTLHDEAYHLHASMFGCTADPVTAERYVAAHRKLFASEGTSALVALVVERGLDVEAIELALRGDPRAGVLRRKMQVLCYLVEARGICRDQFFSWERARGEAALEIAGALFRTVWKRVKGEWLVRRHGLR